MLLSVVNIVLEIPLNLIPFHGKPLWWNWRQFSEISQPQAHSMTWFASRNGIEATGAQRKPFPHFSLSPAVSYSDLEKRWKPNVFCYIFCCIASTGETFRHFSWRQKGTALWKETITTWIQARHSKTETNHVSIFSLSFHGSCRAMTTTPVFSIVFPEIVEGYHEWIPNKQRVCDFTQPVEKSNIQRRLGSIKSETVYYFILYPTL